MATVVASATERTFLGQPIGVAYLAMTEAWERFSFYGMRGLLILYMVQEILLPGRIEKVAGMDAYRAWVTSVFGELSTQAFASQTFGLYSGFVYFTPMLGGLIADRWLGARKTVLTGIAFMTVGHLAMAFDVSFLIALVALVIGSGLLKGNVAAQVGHLYCTDDEANRSKGYVIFSTGINIGATLGPFVCGLLAQVYGWHVGFGLAGIVMLLAAAVYIAGWKHFADDTPRHKRTEAAVPMRGSDWSIVGLVVLVMMMTTVIGLIYDQMSNVGMIWVAEQVDLMTALGAVPVPWFASEDALASIVIVPVLIWLWRAMARGGNEPHDFTKIALGGVVMACAMLSLAGGAMQAEANGKSSLIWPALAFFFSGAGFMFFWPQILSFTSRRAPEQVNALMMAGVYLTAFVTGITSGWLARFYEPWGAATFFVVHAGIALAGTTLFLVFGPLLRNRLDTLERRNAGES
ncbi:putative dipeptide and tripeptide permease YjdL [Tsuneonella dongtanensis]|uniref:Putative dipeptide and tripeptide permease YjdL n=1 Tax=Tsuneonella dongtanensis TaxID=692370 RepID=A0A1B2AAQ6_9SPHN|nr:peptide MFS transporter [Tsuneonella dongtanensis]ANY19226.1 putative dipeptide and tripeptide permease YjdL [Tsuneonella dongtanensis]